MSEPTAETDAPLSAFLLDGKGSGKEVGWDTIATWLPDKGSLWLHLDLLDERSRRWVEDLRILDEEVTESLLGEDSHPRTMPVESGVLFSLKGIQEGPSGESAELVGLRGWTDGERVVTLRRRPLAAVRELCARLRADQGSRDAGEIISDLADLIADRLEPQLDHLELGLGELEERALSENPHEVADSLSTVRRRVIHLQRHLVPQRGALVDLAHLDYPWMRSEEREDLMHTADRIARLTGDLGELRDRAVLVQDQLNWHRTQLVERRMYFVTIIATLFLPLSLIVGLLGINVAGIPGAHSPYAFTIVVVLLAGLGVVQIMLLRRMNWI